MGLTVKKHNDIIALYHHYFPIMNMPWKVYDWLSKCTNEITYEL